MDFEIIGEIAQIEPIAVGRAIRGLARLRKQYGKGRWRKLKGVATVRLEDGTLIQQNYIGTRRTALGRRSSN